MLPVKSTTAGIAYRDSGDVGAPVVFCVHGFPDIPRTWDPLTATLVGKGYRVVAPWLPGYAPSSLAAPLDPVSVADRLLAFADEIAGADSSIYLVGHDWGAVCGYLMLYKQPERFRAAAMLAIPHLRAVEENGPDHPSQLLRSSYMAFFQVPFVSERALRVRSFAMVEKLWQIWSPGFEPEIDYMDELKTCLSESLPAPLLYYRALRSPKQIRSMRALLADDPMNVPTLYLHGERDGCMVPAIGKGQAKYFGSMFEEVHLAEAGHFLHLERPVEVNTAVADWFGTHSPSLPPA
ncbi:MAG: alpha/beta hydrolase [Myxococcota bacterium]